MLLKLSLTLFYFVEYHLILVANYCTRTLLDENTADNICGRLIASQDKAIVTPNYSQGLSLNHKPLI